MAMDGLGLEERRDVAEGDRLREPRYHEEQHEAGSNSDFHGIDAVGREAGLTG